MPTNSCIDSLIHANMLVSSLLTRKVGRDILGVWVSLDTTNAIFTFSYSDYFAQIMTKVGSPED